MESPPAEPAKHGCAASFVGTFAYLVLAMDVLKDEPVTLPVQFVMGLIASFFLMYIARLLGLILRVEPFSQIWYWSRLIPATVVAIGLTGVLYHKQLPSWLIIVSWFTAIFGTTHFWIRKPVPEREGDQHSSDGDSP
jgi:uncharacterized membrane protein